MLINFDQIMKNMDGTDMLENDKSIPMKTFISNALLSVHLEPNISGMDKFKRGELAKKVYDGGNLEISSEDITMIKDAVGKYYPPLVVLPVFSYIESMSAIGVDKPAGE